MALPMKALFKVELLNFKTIHELPNSWMAQNYIDLLEIMDYGDTSELPPEELREMCLMSLTDNEPEDAAKIVLEYVFENRLTKGQIDNISNEMSEEKMWEEYADLSLHENFFNVNQLLYQAYNGKFPHPQAIKFQVRLTAKDNNAFSIFKTSPEAPLIRLLVAGMPKNTLIYRLFEEQVEGEEFKDAEHIIWQFKIEYVNDKEVLVDIISSEYWFHDFKYVKDFEGETFSDVIGTTSEGTSI